MSWQTEPEEDRDLVERGARLAMRVALAVALVCTLGAISAAAVWWGGGA
jgi:hypothetical protein